MTTLKVRFDGQVLVPETPVDLPRDRVFEISVLETETPNNGAAHAAPEANGSPLAGLQELLAGLPEDPNTPTDLAMRSGKSALADCAEQLPDDLDAAPEANDSPLAGLQELLADLPEDPNMPTDLAAQHDHYLYGRPKRP